MQGTRRGPLFRKFSDLGHPVRYFDGIGAFVCRSDRIRLRSFIVTAFRDRENGTAESQKHYGIVVGADIHIRRAVCSVVSVDVFCGDGNSTIKRNDVVVFFSDRLIRLIRKDNLIIGGRKDLSLFGVPFRFTAFARLFARPYDKIEIFTDIP